MYPGSILLPNSFFVTKVCQIYQLSSFDIFLILLHYLQPVLSAWANYQKFAHLIYYTSLFTGTTRDIIVLLLSPFLQYDMFLPFQLAGMKNAWKYSFLPCYISLVEHYLNHIYTNCCAMNVHTIL